MKCLVTGGAGFIGSHLCRTLIKENYQVLCVDNLITGNKKNIQGLLKNPNFKFIQHDVTEPISNFKLEISNLDYIFHLASPASPNRKSKKSYLSHPIETLLANSLGTYNFLMLAKKNNAKFLFASSSEIYGDAIAFPQTEKYFGNVNPVGPRSVYDEGKRFGEAMTMAYYREYNLDVRIVRIFNTYGPNMSVDDGRVVSEFINQAINNKPMTVYGDGMQTRSFCFIDDMVEGLKYAMFSKNTMGKVINLGNPQELKILELAKLIKDMTNSTSRIIFEDLPQDDPKRRSPDITLAKKLLGWKPKIKLEEGLEKTIEYFKSQ